MIILFKKRGIFILEIMSFYIVRPIFCVYLAKVFIEYPLEYFDFNEVFIRVKHFNIRIKVQNVSAI